MIGVVSPFILTPDVSVKFYAENHLFLVIYNNIPTTIMVEIINMYI